MTSSITNTTTGAAIQPEVVDGYQGDRLTRHRFQDITGSDDQDVYVYPAGLRTGTLRLVFAPDRYADAAELAAWLAGTDVLAFDDSDRAELAMSFLASGTITLQLDDETREVWVVSTGFQEVRA